MDKLKVMGFAAALLLLVIAVEYALIYFANVKADILQSLKVFVPATVGVALILVLMPSPKSKEAAEDADKEEEKVDVDKT